MSRHVFALTVPCLVLAGCGWIDKAAAEDTKIIVFSPDKSTLVSVDGGDGVEVGADAFRAIAVGPGQHSVVINGDRTVEVTLEAFDRMVVPVIDDQCFMSLDVSLSHYGDQPTAAPSITARKQSSAPFKLPSGNYLSESELPNSRESSERALLFRSAACATIDELEAATTGGGSRSTAPIASGHAILDALAKAAACPATRTSTASSTRCPRARPSHSRVRARAGSSLRARPSCAGSVTTG